MEQSHNSGISLSNKEIETRLNKMMVNYNPFLKEREYLINKYTEALNDPSKVQWIQKDLEQDNLKKNFDLKRKNALLIDTNNNNNILIHNDKTYKMYQQYFNENNYKDNKVDVFKVTVTLSRKKKKKNEMNYHTNNDNNIHIITQNNSKNNFMITSKIKDNEYKSKRNIYNMINNNDLPNEPTPMNYINDINDNINNKDNQQFNRNDFEKLTNNTNQNISKNNIHHINNNWNISNIKSKRQSLLQNKYQYPIKTRRTISNPKELLSLKERSSYFQKIPNYYIENNTNTTQISSHNSTKDILIMSPNKIHVSPSPTKTNKNYFPKTIYPRKPNDPSQNCYDNLFKILPYISCGVGIFLCFKYKLYLNEQIKKLIHMELIKSINKENFISFLKQICSIINPIEYKKIFYNNVQNIIILLIFVIGLWLVYLKYKEIQLINKIFIDIKNELKDRNEVQEDNESEDSHFSERGLTETDIIQTYSKLFNINEKKFQKKYFPQLKQMRKKDINLKEYEIIHQGKRQIMWMFST